MKNTKDAPFQFSADVKFRVLLRKSDILMIHRMKTLIAAALQKVRLWVDEASPLNKTNFRETLLMNKSDFEQFMR